MWFYGLVWQWDKEVEIIVLIIERKQTILYHRHDMPWLSVMLKGTKIDGYHFKQLWLNKTVGSITVQGRSIGNSIETSGEVQGQNSSWEVIEKTCAAKRVEHFQKRALLKIALMLQTGLEK